MKLRIVLLHCIACSFLSAQVKDSFSDGDFLNNPAWSGDTSHFTINSAKQLQLNNSTAGSSSLFTSFIASSFKNYRWELSVKFSFSPSASNYARVYLVADKANLNDSLNGYFLQFGEALSNDKIELFRQNGKTITSICRGTTSIANGFSIRVKTECDSIGIWKLYVDPSGGTTYVHEANGTDTANVRSAFLGVFCLYTLSNAKGFYFDDVSTGPIIADKTPPVLDSIKILDSKRLQLVFSEALDTLSSQNPMNFVAGKGIGQPVSALLDRINTNRVTVAFQSSFPSGIFIPLSVSGVKDVSFNTATLLRDSFLYFVPGLYDVVINEMMIDPDPSVSILPLDEYIELYNRTAFPVNLKNWKLTVGSSVKSLNEAVIGPNNFLVLCSSPAAASFGNKVRTLSLSSFPALTNSGQQIVLSDSLENSISSVSYTDKWYKTTGKEGGGWSLEQIDPGSPCSGEENWIASEDADGGTPGKINSVNHPASNKIPPLMLRASVLSADTIRLLFSEAVNPQQASMQENYSIDQGIGAPLVCIPVKPDYRSVLLVTGKPILEKRVYSIMLSDTISDCSGNTIALGSKIHFAIAEEAEEGEVRINEVMFDPPSGLPEFVEIINVSDKPLDLFSLSISTMDTLSGILTDIQHITEDQFLFFPGEYIVLSVNGKEIRKKYTTQNPSGFIDLVSFPSLNNDGDVLAISDRNGKVIDRFSYKPTMHFPLLKETKGVSLERLSFFVKTDEISNWHSAAASVGYATPAYKNSQSPTGATIFKEFSLEPELFSPDNDGLNDVLTIAYHLESGGFTANIYIYNAEGVPIRHLVKNETVGRRGNFYWDGVTDTRERAFSGIYVIFMQVFDPKGDTKEIRLPCVLANRY